VIGQKFGMLTVISMDAGRNEDNKKLWLYRCDCGAEKALRPHYVEIGRIKSCGCLRKSGDPYRTHGHKSRTHTSRTYRIWKGMKTRCSNPKSENYKWYGGRGITVCERWMKFENFLADMGEVPEGMTIDRIDSNLNYCPENCRWADMTTQANNKKNTVRLTFNGKKVPLTDVAKMLGVEYNNLRQSLYRNAKRIEKDKSGD
jgi:hypothetical protein